ncbi:MAG: V-type ATP synthase subunit F [Chloroflexota bacterium]|nr:V-type ATP synthase subunit F [Chloroflexota bacterium]
MAQLTVITTTDLAPGFSLTGAHVLAASDLTEAEQLLRRQMAEAPDGIIAYHEHYYAGLSADLREQIEREYRPLVVVLPDGLPARGEISRRQLLSEMLSRVIGYSISFRAEGREEP